MRQDGRIADVERNKPLIGNASLGRSFSLLIYEKLAQTMQHKQSEPPFRLICLLDHATTENNFVEESLGQVFGLFIAITFALEVAVDWLPIAL